MNSYLLFKVLVELGLILKVSENQYNWDDQAEVFTLNEIHHCQYQHRQHYQD